MLLSNLNLGYELTADDPIEMGIHYGESILNFVSAKIQSATGSSQVETDSSPKYFSDSNHVARAFLSAKREVKPRINETKTRSQIASGINIQSRGPVQERPSRDVQRYNFNLRPRRYELQARRPVGVI